MVSAQKTSFFKLQLTFSPALEFRLKNFSEVKNPKMNPWVKFQAISELFQDPRHFAFEYNIIVKLSL